MGMNALLLVSMCTISANEQDSLVPREAPFFSVSVSLLGDSEILDGQDIFLRVRVANPYETPLRYMRQGSIAYETGVDLRHGNELIEPALVGGFGPVVWHESGVGALQKGESLEAIYPLSHLHRELPVGEYNVLARLKQTSDVYGLAKGEAVSNTLSFTIRRWEAEETREKPVAEKPVFEGSALLVKTKDGRHLAVWRLFSRKRSWEHVVPLPLDESIRLDDLLWAADRRACIIAVPNSEREKTRIVVAHMHTSVVESFDLRGGIGVIDNDRPLAIWEELAAPQEPGPQQERPESTVSGPSGQGWMTLCAAGGPGAVIGGLAVWLLMRRKRGAS